MNKIKVLITDIDGVFNPEAGLKKLSKNWTDTSVFGGEGPSKTFCPDSIEAHNRIIRETGAKIVVSSSWRSDGLEAMQKLWKNKGLIGDVIDVTPLTEHQIRGKEIQNWLWKQGYMYPVDYWNGPAWEESRAECIISNYCIVDDDWDIFIQQAPHYVNTPAYYGLAGEGIADKVIEILNSEDLMV
jgi:hypothetical protein